MLTLYAELAGALLILISGISISIEINRIDEKNLRQTEAFIALLRHIRKQIDCFCTPIGEILASCDERILMDCGCTAEYAKGLGNDNAFASLLIGCPEYDRGEGLFEILRSFESELGKSYRGEQLRICDYYISLLLSRSAAIASELPKKKRFTRTLCISISLLAIIILL